MYILSLLALFAGVSAVQIPPVLETLQQHRAVAEQLIPYTADERVRVAQESKKMFEVSFFSQSLLKCYPDS